MEKLKKIFVTTLLVVILFPFTSFSQYIPLLKDNATLHVYQWFDCGINETQQIRRFTVINGYALL